MNEALNHLTQCFKMVKLLVTIQFEEDAQLPAFKGSMLHGWFGQSLKAADEQAYFICFAEHDNQQPKPYIISPSQDHKTHWQKGELYHFEICLFGQATDLVDALYVALKLGERLGLGSQRAPFKVLSITSNSPQFMQSGVHPFTLAEALKPYHGLNNFNTQREVALNLLTPVRLKQAGKICHTGIAHLDFLSNQILRRLVLLSKFWVLDDQSLLDQIATQRPYIAPHATHNHCYFEDWQRYSKKSKEHLPFGGLKGQVSFSGEISAMLPILKIGELLHIGGKTTFGLGKYQLIA